MKNKSTFADRLRKAMNDSGKTAADISRGTEISTAAISRYLKGDYVPKHDKVMKIARYMRVPTPWLMGMDDVVANVRQIEIEKSQEMETAIANLVKTIKAEVGSDISEADKELVQKVNNLSPQHREMVTAMIDGFLKIDNKKRTSPETGRFNFKKESN